MVAYGKYITKPTLVLVSTMSVPPLIYVALLRFNHLEWVVLTTYAVCIIHFIITTIFLIKDREELDDI